jgi:hypothetical protein
VFAGRHRHDDTATQSPDKITDDSDAETSGRVLRIRYVGLRQRRSDGVRQAWTAIHHLQDKVCSAHTIAIIIDPRPKADLAIRPRGFAGIQEQAQGDLTNLRC